MDVEYKEFCLSGVRTLAHQHWCWQPFLFCFSHHPPYNMPLLETALYPMNLPCPMNFISLWYFSLAHDFTWPPLPWPLNISCPPPSDLWNEVQPVCITPDSPAPPIQLNPNNEPKGNIYFCHHPLSLSSSPLPPSLYSYESSSFDIKLLVTPGSTPRDPQSPPPTPYSLFFPLPYPSSSYSSFFSSGTSIPLRPCPDQLSEPYSADVILIISLTLSIELHSQ